MSDNLTAVLYGINDMRLEHRSIPTPKSNQVLLKMDVVGICGSDVHYLVNGKIGPFIVEKPMVIGHEASGTVVKIGENVKHLMIGDKVAIEPGVGCRQCEFCKRGDYHLCLDMKFCATPPYDGNLARYYVHDADFCFKLPSNMDLEDGALMEPLSVGVHACKRGGVKFGDACLIMGAGPIGLLTLMAAKAMGATKVIISDIVEKKLKKAIEIGADYTFKIDKSQNEKQMIEKIKMILGEEPNISFDCTGVEQCARIAIQATKTGGVVVLVGLGNDEMTLPLTNALVREIDIRGIFRYNNDYPTAIEMVRSGKISVKPLITHHFKIEDTLQAFHVARTGEGDPIKILIHPNAEWNN